MKKETIGKGIQYFFQVCFGLLVFMICYTLKKNGIEGLVYFLEKNYFLSVVTLILLYILKSFMLFVPVSLICIAVSVVFSPIEALLINTGGYALSVIIGYYFGSGFGKNLVDTHLAGKTKIMGLLEKMGESRLSTVMLVRFVPCFPNDIMSMFFGAVQIDIKEYFIGSVLGFLPWLFIYSFVGSAIYYPALLQTMIPAVLICLMSVIGTFTYLKATQR